ncbi:MAG: hypothetical protein IJW90_02045 [Clostridia bacterium]|nr:hypothetical protein [Clostridia bacterium]MBQ7315873.1 hypothetical protein [Clostridia bacterium]
MNVNEKIRVFCKLYLGYAAIAAFCIMYVMTSFVELTPTGKSVPMILADGLMAFAFGMGIASMFKTQGILTGKREPEVIAASEEHGRVVEAIVEADDLEELGAWCDRENKKNYRVQRSMILSRAGMVYHECFTDEGAVKAYEPLPLIEGKDIRSRLIRFRQKRVEKMRFKAYIKAVTLRLTELSPGELMSEGGRADDPFYMGRGVGEYRKQTAASDAMGKVVTSVVLGYYGVTLVAGFSPSALIWIIVQVIFFSVMGVLKYNGAFSYVTEEYRERRIKKTRYLKKFRNEGMRKEEAYGNDA